MSLTSALDTAKSSLLAVQTQTSLVSRNIANINDPTASRKYANVVTGPGGRVEVVSVARSQNSVLYRNMLETSASVGSWTAITGGYQRLDEMIGDTEAGRSPAALVSKLSDALQSFAATPNSFEFARTVSDAARDLATSLVEGSQTVATIRRDANVSLGLAAEAMNGLLGEIERLNDIVVRGTSSGQDVTDFIDKRDAAVTALSEYVGVSAKTRGNNDLVLHTDSGVTLFETKARLVEFDGASELQTGAAGPAFKIDGVAVTGTGSYMPIKGGMVHGLTVLRDEIAVTYQAQLDEIARGLVQTFAETNSVTGERKAGLFTWTDAAPVPVTGPGSVPGLAGKLKVADAVLRNPLLIRDGGINDIPRTTANADDPNPFVSNLTGAGGFNARILALDAALNQSDRTYGAPGADTKGSIADFAASSLSWLQAGRAAALSESDYRATLLSRTQDTLSNETGINMEQEMTLLTDLQRSYQASAKLIATIDEMLQTLLQSV